MILVFLCLISFSLISSRSFHVVAHGRISFFLVAEQYSRAHTHVCVLPVFFLRVSVCGHFGGFCMLAIVSSAAVNTGVHISFQIVFSCSSDTYSEVELRDRMVVLVLMF